MRNRFIALCGAAALFGCGEPAPHPFPQSAQARFQASCPATSAVCRCTWDRITRDMTAEEYQAALDRFRETGLMEPKVTHARAVCVERVHDN